MDLIIYAQQIKWKLKDEEYCLHKKKINIFTDDSYLYKKIEILLNSHEYVTYHTRLDCNFSANNYKGYNLIIIDMISIDNSETLLFLDYIRSKNTPIVCLISDALMTRIEVFKRGATDYIGYPIIQEEILYRIKSAIGIVPVERLDVMKGEIKQLSMECENEGVVIARKVLNYLRLNISNDINVEDVARDIGKNRNIIYTVFKEYYGTTPMKWLRTKRMIMSSDLLVSTNYSVQMVSCEVGYSDSNNFTTAFKREFLLSPSEYRNKMKKSM